jgi:2-dehydro-3-deoxyphosphogluconate aldolase / (4S)-4-hydroxy-2-oxoglutarate aldolase
VDPRSLVRQKLIEQRVVPVLRLPSAELTERAVDCLAEAGFTTFEITMTTPHAVALVRKLSRFTVGAGTVLDLETARRCLDAGAQFVVSPVLIPDLPKVVHERGAAVLTGGFTPGEILAAHRQGADIVKLFPASSGGPEHLKAIHTVFPDVLLCPTGGVSLQNLRAYFDAGAALVGVGNNILDLAALQAGSRARVVAHARRFLE